MADSLKVSEAFGRLVTETVGTDSLGRAQIKTQISQAYLLAMKRGKVPSREIIERFANGYNMPIAPFLKAAGFDVTSDPIEAVDIALRQTVPELSDFDKERILDVVREVTKEIDGDGE